MRVIYIQQKGSISRPAFRRVIVMNGMTLLETSSYDGRGFRIEKTVSAGVNAGTFDYYQNAQNQVLEVRKGSNMHPAEQYVYSPRYIDSPVLVYTDVSNSLDGSAIKAIYYVQDANFNVTALVDGATGTVLLRKLYTPYGAQTLLNADWTPADNSTLSTTIHSAFGSALSTGVVNAVINTLTNGPGFQGLARDGESGLIYSRARYTNPSLGTFMTPEPFGGTPYVDGMNLYQQDAANPINLVDPSGQNVDPDWSLSLNLMTAEEAQRRADWFYDSWNIINGRPYAANAQREFEWWQQEAKRVPGIHGTIDVTPSTVQGRHGYDVSYKPYPGTGAYGIKLIQAIYSNGTSHSNFDAQSLGPNDLPEVNGAYPEGYLEGGRKLEDAEGRDPNKWAGLLKDATGTVDPVGFRDAPVGLGMCTNGNDIEIGVLFTDSAGVSKILGFLSFSFNQKTGVISDKKLSLTPGYVWKEAEAIWTKKRKGNIYSY